MSRGAYFKIPIFIVAFMCGVGLRSFFDIPQNLVLVGIGLLAGLTISLSRGQVLQYLAQPRHGGASRAIRQQADMRVLAKSDSKAQKNAGTKFSPADIAASFEQAVVDVLVKKTMKAAEQYKPKTIVLGGGVAANDRLREELSNQIQRNFPLITFHLPLLKFTGDNAAMIAVAAYFRAIKKQFANPKTLKAQGNLKLK